MATGNRWRKNNCVVFNKIRSHTREEFLVNLIHFYYSSVKEARNLSNNEHKIEAIPVPWTSKISYRNELRKDTFNSFVRFDNKN